MTSQKEDIDDVPQHDQLNNNGTHKDVTWRHWSLRISTFVAFAATIGVTIVVLGILNLYSACNNGICSAGERAHYAWTYLPTAFFTLLAFLWSGTDYYAKQIQPWECMAKGPQPAAHSVLLDYVSPMNVVVLAKACYRRHYLSGLVVGVTICLQLAITLSTGLFSLDKRELPDTHTQIHISDRFLTNGSKSNSYGYALGPWITVLSSQEYGLSPPRGTTFDSAFQSFTLPEELGPHVVSTSAVVEVFTSVLTCQPLTYAPWQSDPTSAKPTTQMCSTGVTPGAGLIDLEAHVEPGWAAWIGIGGCHASASLIIGVSSKAAILGRANMTADTTALLCEPKYKIEPRAINLYRNSRVHVSENVANPNPRGIQGLSAGQLANEFYSMLSMNTLGAPTVRNRERYSSLAWASLTLYEPPKSIAAFRDVHTMESWLQGAWSKYSAQLAHAQLKRHDNSTVGGIVTVEVERLVVRGIAFWLMQAVLMITELCLVCACCVRIGDQPVRNTASLIGLATSLAPSSQLFGHLLNMGHSNDKALKNRLKLGESYMIEDFENQSGLKQIRIIFSRKDHSDDDAQDTITNVQTWFRPFPMRYEYRIGMPLLLVALILILEMLFRRSESHQGVLRLSQSSLLQHLAWTYLPTITMIGTATLALMLQFWVSIFQPHNALWKGCASSRKSLCRYPLGLFSLPTAMRHLETAVLATTLLSTTASFLPIVISGLYTMGSSMEKSSAITMQIDWFSNETFVQQWPSLLLSLVTAGKLSSPKLVYGDLVPPRIGLRSHDNATTFNAMIPVLRGRFNCTTIPPDLVSTEVNFWGGPDKPMSVKLKAQGGCANIFQWFIPWEGQIGVLYSIYHKPVLTVVGEGASVVGSVLSNGTGGQDCPAVYGMLTDVGPNAEVRHISMFSCRPFAQQAMANVTLKLPEIEVDSSRPPFVHEEGWDKSNVTDRRETPLDLFYQIDAIPSGPQIIGSLRQLYVRFGPWGARDTIF